MKNLITALSLLMVSTAASAEYVPEVDLDREYFNVWDAGYEQISFNQIFGNIVEVEMACNNDVCVPHMLYINTELGYFKVSASSDIDYVTGGEIIINVDIYGVDAK